MKKSLIFLVVLFTVLMSVSVSGLEDDEIYHLRQGEEHMDKTFVYDVESEDADKVLKGMCAEMKAPTYDSKKGLITWIDYKVYSLEEVFGQEKGGHIRAILNTAGPQLVEEDVVAFLKERTGISKLTYDEVVSAMQYATWYYTDDDFRIPSTSNGEDLYRYFITLPIEREVDAYDVVDLESSDMVKNSKGDKILMQFSYKDNGANLSHRYSVNLSTVYNAKEEVEKIDGKTVVTLTFPVITESMAIDFDVTIYGTMKEVTDIMVLAPEVKGSLQMLVASNTLKNSVKVQAKKKSFRFRSYRLILDDDGDKSRSSHDEGEFLTVDDLNDINQVGKNGYTFIGWFDESNMIVSEGITMNMDRYLTAVYAKDKDQAVEDVSNSNDSGNPNDGSDPNDGSNPSDPKDESSLDSPSDTDDVNSIDQVSDMDNEINSSDSDVGRQDEFTDEDLPADGPKDDIADEGTPFGWMPKTGGIPLLIFLLVGSLTLIGGGYLRKKRQR